MASETLSELEKRVGHPQEMWEKLSASVQESATEQFSDIEDDWLRLMWSLDCYRVAGLAPRKMGAADLEDPARLAAVYRSKGNWFATILASLLQNRTEQQIRPRTKIEGFSQLHQIDLAWPVRNADPLICAETKVTGAPGFGNTPIRRALSDWSNRRKELKFAATDLKLFRRQQETDIRHWGSWREGAPPKTYFLWAARLAEPTAKRGGEDVRKLVLESQALVQTYLDGAGLLAWRLKADRSGYESVPLPAGSRTSNLDDVLYRIASTIREQMDRSKRPPPPELPTKRAINIENLLPDT